ncbi:MAG: VCBS repeat-containing protein [Pyrinomonadaceae bacterium]|nr:VCBS repeat-containing protein [Pyrinomonadaceae bacterium]
MKTWKKIKTLAALSLVLTVSTVTAQKVVDKNGDKIKLPETFLYNLNRGTKEVETTFATRDDNPSDNVINPMTYPFTFASGAVLEDMSTGTISPIGPNLDDDASPLVTIPFSFSFDGVFYTSLSFNANGLLKLGSPVVTTAFVNDLDAATNNPKISPFWDDLCTGSNGKVHYKTVGTAPNQRFVIEWLNILPRPAAGCATGAVGTGTFQVQLNENGRVDFVYGTMPTSTSYSVGIANNVPSLSLASVTTSANTVSYTPPANDANTVAIPSGTRYSFTPVPPTANDIAATALINPTNNGGIGVGTTFSPQASFTNNGTSAQTNVPVRYQIRASDSSLVYNQTATIPSLASGATVTVTFPSGTISTNGTYTIQAIAELAGDEAAANNTISGTITAGTPLPASVNVGAGETFTSLSNSGGLFAALNNFSATGNVTVNITSDLSGETGTVFLNQLPNNLTVTIKPSGAARTITGTAAEGLLTFRGADNVTLDGSLSNGTDRNLTVTNNGVGESVLFITGNNGAQNNVVKNLNVRGLSPTGTILGIGIAGNAFGSPGADNDNNRIENCNIQSVVYGVYAVGESAANKNNGLVITRNTFGGTGANALGRIGVFVGFDNGVQITENTIVGVSSAGNVDTIGIGVGTQLVDSAGVVPVEVTNAFVSRNNVGSVVQTNTFSSAGIALAGGAGGPNTIVNNFVSGVISNGNLGDIVAGIWVVPIAGATQNIYFNSVSLTGDRGSEPGQFGSFGFAIAGTVDAPVDVRNNIFYNIQTQSGGGASGRSYAYGIRPTTFANLTSNYNDLFVGGAQATLGITGGLVNSGTTPGIDRATFADFRTATGKEANSLNVNPLFVSTTDLHLQATSPVQNLGIAIPTVTTDFDGNPRRATPDIGGDEVGGKTPFDFDGDGRADLSVFRPSENNWYLLGSQAGFTATQFGISTDKLTPADFDGDGKTDIATFRNGVWYVLPSLGGGFQTVSFGAAGDIALPGDYDGDGKADYNFFRPSNGTWFRLNVTTNQFTSVQFGQAGDVPVIADFDADGKTDIAVFRPSNGTWFWLQSSNTEPRAAQFGLNGDVPLSGDFNGDGRSDLAVFRPSSGIWFVARPTGTPSENFDSTQFGNSTDKPVAADYDGDGKTDIAVFRNGNWLILGSQSGFFGTQFGISTDIAVPNVYAP